MYSSWETVTVLHVKWICMSEKLNFWDLLFTFGINSWLLSDVTFYPHIYREGKESLEAGAHGEDDSKSLSEETGVRKKG